MHIFEMSMGADQNYQSPCDSFRFRVAFWQMVRQSNMFHAEVDTSGKVLTRSFGQHVDSEEMKSCLEKVRGMLVDIKPGFRLLTDLTSWSRWKQSAP